MKLSAFLLAMLTALMPAAALIRGPELAAFSQANSIWQILGWALVGSAVCLALLMAILLEAIESQGKIVIRTDGNGKIRQIDDAGREGGKAA